MRERGMCAWQQGRGNGCWGGCVGGGRVVEGLRGEVWRGVSAPTDGPLEESQVTGSSGGREEQVGVGGGSGNTRHGKGAGGVRRHISGSDDRIRLGSQPRDLWVGELNIFRCRVSGCRYKYTHIKRRSKRGRTGCSAENK